MSTWRIVIGCIAAAAALPAQDGTLQWPFAVGGYISSSSPAVSPDGSTVYVGVEGSNGRGRVFAIPRDGSRQKWVTPALPQPIVSSPALSGDTLYIGGTDGRLYALNAETGSIRWQKEVGGFITSSPAIGADGSLYFGAGDRKLHALSPVNGDERWAFLIDSPEGVIESSPAIGPDGTIYVGAYDRNLYAVRPDGTERWRFQTGGQIFSSPAVGADGTIYVGSDDQRMYAISPEGQKKWDYLTNGPIQSSPALGADGTIFFASDVTFYALRPDGTEAWKNPYGSTTQSTAAVRADGTIIFGADDGKVRALNPADGSAKWTFDTKTGVGNYIESSPVIAPDGSIYVGSLDGNLYKIAGNGSPASTFSPWPAFHRDPQRTGRAIATTPGQLFNLSTRAQVPAGEPVVVGFFVQGVSSKPYLLRGIGPALAQFGISGFMTDPRLDLYSGTHLLTSNDNWGESPPGFGIADTTERVGAFPLPSGSRDAVVVQALEPGLYTARVSNNENRAGVALVEAYDAIGGDPTARLLNVSTLGPVGAIRENYLVAGVSVGGTGPTRLLVRAIGPGLAQFGVSGVLARPMMTLYTSGATPQALRTNSGWMSERLGGDIAAAAQTVAAFALAPNSTDAAMIVTVDPGNYTVEVAGANGTTGQALVELYVLPQ